MLPSAGPAPALEGSAPGRTEMIAPLSRVARLRATETHVGSREPQRNLLGRGRTGCTIVLQGQSWGDGVPPLLLGVPNPGTKRRGTPSLQSLLLQCPCPGVFRPISSCCPPGCRERPPVPTPPACPVWLSP